MLENFHAVLGRLASPAEEQVQRLIELGVAESLDELALEFDDLYQPLKSVLRSLPNGTEVSATCEMINVALSSETLGWGFDDLDSAEWGAIRNIAGHARDLVGFAIA